MPKFTSPAAAFAWAFEIMDVWRVGKGFDPDPDFLGGGNTGNMGVVLLALSISIISDRHDPGICKQTPPIDRTLSWFEKEWISQEEPHFWRSWEQAKLEEAICNLCLDFLKRNLVVEPPCKSCQKKVDKL